VIARLFTVSLLAAIFVSCDRKNRHGIEYREISHEQSVADATDAFADRNEAIKAEPEIDSFFNKLGKASRSEKDFDISEFVSVDAMIETAEAADAFDGMGGADKRRFLVGFRKGIGQLDDAFRQMSFDRHRIVRLECPAENRRIAFVIQYDNDLNVSVKMRWWLVRTDQGWRVHDYEDLSVGLRAVGVIVTMMKAGVGKSAEPWIADFLPAALSMRQIDVNDPDTIVAMREPMQRLLRHKLPTDIRRFASAMLVSAHTAAEDYDEAEQELQAAESGGYQSPMADYQLGHIMMNREEWRKALEAFGRNIAVMGADSDTLESVSDCHYHLGEMESARAAALKGLDDNPRSVNCLACLVAACTTEQLSDPALGARFEATGDAEAAYEAALDYLISLEAREKALALFTICRSQLDEKLVGYYEEELSETAEE
jgi:hypothetical protein